MKSFKNMYGCFLLAALVSLGLSIPVYGGEVVSWGVMKTPDQPLTNLTAVAAGGYHSLALKSDGSIVGWGRNYIGQATPPAGNNFVAVAAGGWHSLALKSDGSIVGWGNNDYSQATPPADTDFVAIAAGRYHNLALKSDGSIVGWGYNYSGQATPPAGADFVAVAAGGWHSLALKSDGSIVGWGWNYYGQATPPEGSDFVAVAAGGDHSLALKSDGSIVGWGWNDNGQATPPAGNDFVVIAAGGGNSLAIVELNTPPVAVAGPNQTAYAWIDGIAEVNLDGSASYDDDGDALTYLWSWEIEPNVYEANGVSLTIELPIGEHTIELIVNDGMYDSEPNCTTVTVIEPLKLAMKFTPQALNPGSKSKWIKAHFVLPEGYNIEDVNTDTPVSIEPMGIESDYINVFINEDGLVEIVADFDRTAFCTAGIDGEFTEVTVIGLLTSGRYFVGSDTIRIITNNFEYLAVLASHWLETGCGASDWCGGTDLDQNTMVDFVDFALFDGCCIEVIKQ